MKHNVQTFTKQILGACLLGAILSFSPVHAQEESGFEYTLRMPYSQDYLLLLRQFHAPHEVLDQFNRKAYFELYRLNLGRIKSNDKPPCAERAQTLMPFAQEQVKIEEFEIEAERTPGFMLMKSLCTDLDQDGKDEIFLGLNSDFYFGSRHLGFFLYGESGHQTQNLLNMENGTFPGDDVRLRPGKDPKVWPDLIRLSFGFMPHPGEPYEANFSAFRYSTERKAYEYGKLIFSDEEVVYETQHKPLRYPDFSGSTLNPDKLVLNRTGSLIGFIDTESIYPSDFTSDAITVVESQTGRAEKVFLDDYNKGLVQGLKKRFPEYLKHQGVTQFVPQILGFNQEDLIFKLDIYGSCMEVGTGPCKDVSPMNPKAWSAFEKKYPQRFAGYWAYHYRTGAFKLISWNSQASVSVEHPGYHMAF